MKDADLIQALKRIKVQTGGLMYLGCGHEHNCGVHGCAVIREAAQRLEEYHQGKEHIDRETWEKPCSVCGGKTTLYQQTNTTKLFVNTFGKKATLVTECVDCLPYADCCMKDVSANSAFKIKFCPECGRPLTEEAWAELGKKLQVAATAREGGINGGRIGCN